MNAKERSNCLKHGRGLANKVLVTAFAVTALAVITGCGEDESTQGSGEQEQVTLSRVGEPCGVTSDCKEGLACLGDQQICVILCEVGSEQCGEGIPCQPAGRVGFCPPPAMPDLDGADASE